MRNGFSLLKTIFSTAINTIESAIIGSTMAGGAAIMFFILSIKVMVCAIVNADACQKRVLILALSIHKPTTNSMWSSPKGSICS